ncbi:MAG TPA: glycosyltransferase family 4 protein [Pyrinomonadaceae bacterium]|nr:glycosyltransferase family 4 protein [Pyrinomonadaceae bacterium]
MVLETPFPPDIRVEKEMRALRAGGYSVTLLCGHKEGQPLEEEYEGFRIVRFKEPVGGTLHKAASLLHHWATARKRAWEQAVTLFAQKNNIEALHVHDLPLVPTCLAAARRLNIPLVFDMHEIYPVMIRGRMPTAKGLRQKLNSGIHSLLFSPGWWDSTEMRAVEHSDHIVVVIEESKDRLIRMGIPGERVSVVLNAEDIDSFLAIPEQSTIAEKYSGDFLVGYVGGVDNPNRGLENLVRALPLLIERIPGTRLLIVGDGPLRPTIEALVQELGLSERVIFTGWVPFTEVPAYVKAVQVAVIPHIINEHTNHTIPHKLFQYIALGKPVVASDIAPVRRILDDTGAGIIAREWSPQGFAEAIIQAHERLKSGAHDPRKQEAVLRAKYGFEAVSEPLLKLYKRLEKNRTVPPAVAGG